MNIKISKSILIYGFSIINLLVTSGCYPGGAEEYEVAQRFIGVAIKTLCSDEDFFAKKCKNAEVKFDTAAGSATIIVYGVTEENKIHKVVQASENELHSLRTRVNVKFIFIESRESKKVLFKTTIG